MAFRESDFDALTRFMMALSAAASRATVDLDDDDLEKHIRETFEVVFTTGIKEEAASLGHFPVPVITAVRGVLARCAPTTIRDAQADEILTILMTPPPVRPASRFSVRNILSAPFATRRRQVLTAAVVIALAAFLGNHYFGASVREWLASKPAATETQQQVAQNAEDAANGFSEEDQQMLASYLESTGGALSVEELTPEQAQKLLTKAKAAKPVAKKGKPAKKVALKTADAGPAGGDTAQPAEWKPFRVASDTLLEQVNALDGHHKETGVMLTAVSGQVVKVREGLQAAETVLGEVTTRHDTESKAIGELKVVAVAMRNSDESASKEAQAANERMKALFAPKSK